MESKATPSANFDFAGIIQIFSKWKKQLFIITIIAAVAAFVFTRPFFMPDYFESTAIIYPSNIAPFSLESPTETMLQIVQSEDIKDQLVNEFDLYNHYHLNKKSATHRAEMYEVLNANISFTRTAYESIRITVADQNPDTAAMMADSIVAHLNIKMRTLHAIKYKEVVDIFKFELDFKQHELDSMQNLAQEYSTKYGIVDFKNQVREVTRAYYGKGNDPQVKETYNNFREKGVEAKILSDQIKQYILLYAVTKGKYDDAVKDYNKQFTHTHVVTTAKPSDVKAYPHRTVILIIFSLSVLFFSFLVVLWIEQYRKNIQPRLQS